MTATMAGVEKRTVRARWLGRIGFADALEIQRETARSVAAGGEEELLLLEHEPVFTLGRNATAADVLMDEDERSRRGIAVFETDRGGKVTCHGPGQLVGYPILNLAPDRRDVKAYVTDLEEAIIRTLAAFGVASERSARKDRVTSVWVGNDKIAAIGVHISRWITTHGFALNVTDEPLALFSGIVPCGITDGGVTSIERAAGRAPSLREVADRFVPEFAGVFSREIIAP
jgi:lipoyl(octanoyl) transferase